MAKPEWGSKRTCQSCATVFYDFHRDPIICPNCGATVEPEQPVKSRRSRNDTKPKPAAKAAVVAEAEAESDTAEEETDDLLLDSNDEDADDSTDEQVDTSLVDSDDIDVNLDDDDEEDDTVLAADEDDDDEDVQGIVDTGDSADDELTK